MTPDITQTEGIRPPGTASESSRSQELRRTDMLLRICCAQIMSGVPVANVNFYEARRLMLDIDKWSEL